MFTFFVHFLQKFKSLHSIIWISFSSFFDIPSKILLQQKELNKNISKFEIIQVSNNHREEAEIKTIEDLKELDKKYRNPNYYLALIIDFHNNTIEVYDTDHPIFTKTEATNGE